MSEPVRVDWLQGKRVAILVWNGFTHDARVLRESESVARQGAEVRVICLLAKEHLPEYQVLESGIGVQRVRTDTWLSRLIGRFAPRLETLLEEVTGTLRMTFAAIGFRPDIVHGNDVNTLIPAWAGSRFRHAGFIYDAHEISADREGYRNRVPLVQFLERNLGGRADAWMTTTRMRAEWFEENYGVTVVHVVQNRPQPSAHRSRLIREKLNIADSDVVALYQGGLQPGRGLRNLVRASAGVEGLCLVMIGDGPLRSELEQIATEAEAPVLFVGQVDLDQLPLWTASSDVGMQVLRNTCLNHYTTDSNKLFEYAMGGLAVVASDFPEIRAVVEAYDIGLLIDPERIEEIHLAMSRLTIDVELRDRFKRNAVHSRDHLDWYSQEPELFAAYGLALGIPENVSEAPVRG